MALPGWDSPSAVVAIHAALEGAALLFFAALVVFDMLAHLNKKRELILERIGLVCFGVAVLAEIAAYPYSRRNDDLSAEAMRNADKRIADLNKEAANARKETEQVRKEGEGLKKQAEDERLARVRIEASVVWRRLTEEQKREIGSALGRTFANQGVSLWYRAGDTEGSWFAADIADALTDAHTLRVYPPASIMLLRENGPAGGPIGREVTGVTLQSTNDDRSRRLAAAIIHELTILGFDASRQTDPPFDPNPVPQVWVNVEPRPMGPQGKFKLEAQHSGR